MKTIKTRLGILAKALGATTVALGAASAQAAPIAAFQFETIGGFYVGTVNDNGAGEGAYGTDGFGTCGQLVGGNIVNASGTCNLTLTGNDSLSDPGDFQTFRKVSWGTPSTTGGAQSSLEVFHLGDGTTPITTDGTWTNIDRLVHTNNVLQASGGWMDSIGVYGKFLLTGGHYSLGSEYPLLFTETLNSAPCPAGTPPSIANPVCPDFYLTLPLTASDTFVVDDYLYTIQFQFVAGPGAVVETLEIGGMDWVRIWTQENSPGTSTVFTQARITYEQIPVPEPGILALLGIGLAGLGVMNRRRKTETSS